MKDYKSTETWEIHSATKTQEQCEAGLNAIWKHKLSAFQKVSNIEVNSGPGFIGVVYPPIEGQYHSTIISWLCLPDTIDPRKAKR